MAGCVGDFEVYWKDFLVSWGVKPSQEQANQLLGVKWTKSGSNRPESVKGGEVAAVRISKRRFVIKSHLLHSSCVASSHTLNKPHNLIIHVNCP
jgi:hypothetical protein